MFGKDWKRVAKMIPTRTVVQIRTHAQKYFQKLAKDMGVDESFIHTNVVTPPKASLLLSPSSGGSGGFPSASYSMGQSSDLASPGLSAALSSHGLASAPRGRAVLLFFGFPAP